MRNREDLLGEILSRIADELNITDTMFDKAVTSYQAVGNWIGEGIDYKVTIMPQGSMNLGTVVRPLDDRDDYDIDLVCLLEDGKELSPSSVKHIVGNRLKENKVYRDKLDKEGRRCWTMQYDEFHMDILPCVPKDEAFIVPEATEIDLTDKNKSTGDYRFKVSNPSAYHDWFVSMARPYTLVANSKFAAATEIKPVPSQASRLKTPLQKAIQLLKRHRDVCFINHQDEAPISVIITTLAAKACPHGDNVFTALKTVLDNMGNFVESRADGYWVPNPVLPSENFAERWNVDSGKKLAFDNWLKKAKQEFLQLTSALSGLDEYAQHFKKILYPQPVERAFNKIGDYWRNSRESGSLKLTGLTTGLAVSSGNVGKTVTHHTFYGK